MRDPGRNSWTFYEPAADGSELLPPAPFDALSDPSVEDLLPAGLALWPRGAAWGTPDGQAAGTGTVLAGFTRALLAPFADLYRRAFLLTKESRALTLVGSLPDWEGDYGLPDACSPDPAEAARRRALLTRVRSVATITPQDFIQLARQEGFDIAIEEPDVFECGFSECGGAHTVGDRLQEVYWIVHLYGLAVDYFRCGESECGHDPLFAVADVDRLQCLFARLDPGWTQPVYVIHEPTDAEAMLEGFEAGLALDFLDETFAVRVAGEPDLAATGPIGDMPGLSFSRASEAYRVNGAGAYESVGIGGLRFDHDPATLARKGALMEAARTNSIKNSAMQGAAAGVLPTGWRAPYTNATGITMTVAGAGIEDGIAYTDWDVSGTSAGGGTAFLYCFGGETDIAAVPGQVWSGSAFVRLAAGTLDGTTWAGGVNGLFLFAYDASLLVTNGPGVNFTPAAGPLGTGRVVNENWTTPAGTATLGMCLRFQVAAGAPVSFRIRIGWPQLERGVFASSPIRTTTAVVTRSADSFSSSIDDMPEGAMFIEAETSARTIVGNNGLVQVDGGSTGNRICVYQLGQVDRRLAIYVASGGVVSANTAVGATVAPGAVVKAAVSWSGGTATMCVNGGVPATFNSVVVPMISALRVGGGGGGISGNPWDGPVRRAALFRRALSNAELQALTS